jgi:hypothetical protein
MIEVLSDFFFTVAFNGYTTQHIAHNAEANGASSLREYLSRLPNIGDVIVNRSMSKVFHRKCNVHRNSRAKHTEIKKKTDLSALCRPAEAYVSVEQIDTT